MHVVVLVPYIISKGFPKQCHGRWRGCVGKQDTHTLTHSLTHSLSICRSFLRHCLTHSTLDSTRRATRTATHSQPHTQPRTRTGWARAARVLLGVRGDCRRLTDGAVRGAFIEVHGNAKVVLPDVIHKLKRVSNPVLPKGTNLCVDQTCTKQRKGCAINGICDRITLAFNNGGRSGAGAEQE